MRDITLAIDPDHRQGYTRGVGRNLAMAGERLAQGLVDLRIAGDKLSVDRAQNIARADDVVAGTIGMNDPAGGVDQEYRGAEGAAIPDRTGRDDIRRTPGDQECPRLARRAAGS